jgi:hypothetical protein
MENRPVKSLGIIWGAGMGRYHQQDMADLRQSFCGPQTEHIYSLGDGVKNPPLRDVTDMFQELCRPEAGRALVVMMADARIDAVEMRGRQPLQAGRLAQVDAWMYELNRVSRQRVRHPTPLDVFLLVAQQTIVRRHAERLPQGSVFVAVKTPAVPGKNAWLNTLNRRKDNDAPWPASPGAKELLLDYLLSDGPLARARSHKSYLMPQIVVPDHYTHATLSDIWRNITRQNLVGQDILAQSVRRLEHLQELMGYSPRTVRDAIHCLTGVASPNYPADYSGALLAGRADLFGLDSDWSWIDRSTATPAIGVDIELPILSAQASVLEPLADSGSLQPRSSGALVDYEKIAQRGARRLSAHEVAALPPRLRPIAHLPIVRKLVRRP